MKMKNLDTFKGCLFGGAIGDALGYAVEFSNIEQIREQYGPGGIRALQLFDGKALISDDTQMTLFTANGILTGMTRERLDGERRPMDRYLHNAYMDWHRTQRLVPRSEAGAVASWIYHDKRLHSVRAPGGTCLRSLASGVMGTMEHPINTSKGCGGVMRCAPIGLFFDRARYPLASVDLLGARSAALTHGHQLGFLSAAALVHIVNQCVYGEFTGQHALYEIAEDCVRALGTTFSTFEKTPKLQDMLRKAIALSKQHEKPDAIVIAEIGEGWVAEEALSIALYCALRHQNDFSAALVAAVNHSGDSDSTGSITGNILGAYLGYDCIPASFLDHLEMTDLIGVLCDDLYALCATDGVSLCATERWQRKYVKADYQLS